MKNQLLFLVFTFLGFSSTYLFAQKDAKKENSLFWEISGKGLKKNSYLYGTIHIICSEDLNIDDSMKKKIENSHQLVLEMDMDDPNLMLASAQLMMMPNGNSLKKMLKEEDFKLVNTFFKDSLSIDLGFYGIMKPFLLSSMMITKYLPCKTSSYEMELVSLAKKQKIEILGLETMQEQMAAVDKIPYERQAEMLVESVKDFKKGTDEFQKMMTHYKQKDLNGLYSDIQNSDDIADYETSLLKERNEKWIPQIEKLSAENSTFYAVGAGHLAGDNGIINLLRKKGYTVKPVL